MIEIETTSDVNDAFLLLQEVVDKEITSVNDEGAELLRLGQLDQARRQLGRSEQLVSFRREVDALRRSYAKIGVLRKRNTRGRKIGGTPKDAFYEPILRVLRQMGGRGQAREVADQVGQIMGSKLANEVDQEPLGDGLPRWLNRCYWARHELKLKGKLKSDSPRGIWELC